MANQRFGDGSFDDDEPTRYFGGPASSDRSRDDDATEYLGGRPDDDRATEYFGGSPDQDQETQFFGDNSAWGATGTNAAASAPPGGSDRRDGQYWAPLNRDEQGYNDSDFAQPGGQRPADAYPPQQPPGQPQRYSQQPPPSSDDGGGGGGAADMVKGFSAKGIIGIVAAVVIIGLLLWFFLRDTGGAPEPEPAPPVETTTEAPAPEETLTPEQSPSPLEGELDRLREELDTLREDPPTIPGLPGSEVTEQVIPEAVGKSPAEVELNLRRLGFSNVSVVDAGGSPVSYSLVSVTGSVSEIQPPAGSGVTTDTPVTVTLR